MGIKILTVLLLILKILGIVLLVLLGILLALLLIVLFVPVRYQGSGYREEGDPVPVHVQLKVTWLLHLVRVSFIYPEEAFLKVKVLFFQILPAKEKKKYDRDAKKESGTGRKSTSLLIQSWEKDLIRHSHGRKQYNMPGHGITDGFVRL